MSVRYPVTLESDVVLRDGSTVHVRPARPEDVTLVEDYLIALSPESRRLRFWSQAIDVGALAQKVCEVDFENHLTLLVLHADEMIGGAQYSRADPRRAEISLSVADAWQTRGIGSILLGHLAQAAAMNGISIFVAEVLAENHRMINVFRTSGFPMSIRALPGSIEVEFPISLTAEAIAHFEQRQTEASVNAMRTFLSPQAVAVIGASRDPSSIGGQLFHNLLVTGFSGPVYPVNPKAEVVHSVPAYPSVEDVPGPVDIAFIVVPAPFVLEAAEECGRKGVRGLVVISSGFSEVGGEGIERQRRLVEICRSNGMRLIGPNCMGIINTAPDISLNGTFATVYPPAGRVGFLSQSGALGLAVMQYANEVGLGLSSFVSVGNKGDISGNDLVAYWDKDPGTDVMLLYLESFGNPRRFARLARDIGMRKPIIVVKSGRSSAGQRAAASHTGALLAASDVTVDALFRQSGVIRTNTLGEMFDVATLLANQPVPKGDRIAIVTNAGGLGILCADTCEANGLKVNALSDATTTKLRDFLPGQASVGNPVDMIASATAEDYGRAIRIVADDPDVDAMIVIYIPPQIQYAPEITRAITEAIHDVNGRIPIAMTYMTPKNEPPADAGPGAIRIPRFAFPEDAAIAVARACAYGRWRERPAGTIPTFDGIRSDEAYAIVARALSHGGGWLHDEEVWRLLDCYGVPQARAERVTTPEEAAEAAGRIGAAVALKALGPEIVHKTELGAVRLGLRPEELRAAAEEMSDRMRAAGIQVSGFLIQEMIRGGVEMLVGVAHDRLFGPVIACSAGGTAVEVVHDVSVSVTPITDVDAAEMVRSLKTYPLLTGFRGAPPADVERLQEVLLRVSALVEAHAAIAEMDCNPVMVLPEGEGARVVDARIRVEPLPPERPLSARAD